MRNCAPCVAAWSQCRAWVLAGVGGQRQRGAQWAGVLLWGGMCLLLLTRVSPLTRHLNFHKK